MNKATQKYLDRHAEPESRAIGQSPLHGAPFGHVLVIPVFSEGENLFETLASIPTGPQGPILIIVVVNGGPNASEQDHQQNRLTLDRLKNRFPHRNELAFHPPFSFHEFPVGKLLIVDRSSPSCLLPEKEGVGLARKIGCDIALSLQAQGQLKSPWIHTTDADVILPSDYFERAEMIVDEEIIALLYPFHHDCSEDPQVAEAMRLYEIHLRYYVAGLSWAASPYAFHTIGSTLAFRAASYAAVGGFPKRMAGEDFYLLNKLAKVGRLHSLSGSPICIQGRLSQRVPFGTGMALHKILKNQKEGNDYCLYHPHVFDHLKFWLSFIDELTEKYNKNLMELWANWIREAPSYLYKTELVQILESMEALEAVQEAASRSSDPSILRRHLHTWFDGFRTLKLIHALRDEVLPSIPWEEALAKTSFILPFEKGGLGGIYKIKPPLFKIPDTLISLLRNADRVTVLTGAGISAESGIPTFRDAQTGFWANYKPEELATAEGFLKNPKMVWEWYVWRRNKVGEVEPNPGHIALAEMEKRISHFTLITQNVDGLHRRAGNKRIIELHGNIQKVKCFERGHPVESWEENETPPRCSTCGSLLRPDVVWFGEMLPPEALDEAFEATRSCELFFSIGTSSLVQPAASLPFEALREGLPVVEINPEETPLTPLATYSLRGLSGEILPQLVKSTWPS